MESASASLSNEVFELDLFKQFPSLGCPIYFFVGRKDIITNSKLSERYFKNLTAPEKQLFWFEKSGHGIPDTEPELMQSIIIEKILANNLN
jgi:pimeloyl-ACP methyl ester carboxylesterase